MGIHVSESSDSLGLSGHISKPLVTHKNQGVLESHVNEAKFPNEISSTCVRSSDHGAEKEGLSTPRSTLCKAKNHVLHSSDEPYIMNIKEEDYA